MHRAFYLSFCNSPRREVLSITSEAPEGHVTCSSPSSLWELGSGLESSSWLLHSPCSRGCHWVGGSGIFSASLCCGCFFHGGLPERPRPGRLTAEMNSAVRVREAALGGLQDSDRQAALLPPLFLWMTPAPALAARRHAVTCKGLA